MVKEGNSDGMRELQLLQALAKEPEVRQVDLAAQLGVAVGTVNWLLKRLASKGYVKIKRIGQWRWHYLLTPRGFVEKTRLTQQYLQDSMYLYRQTRQEAKQLLHELKKGGYDEVLLEGDPGNDLMDVCRLTCLEQGVRVIGSADPVSSADPISSITEVCSVNRDGRQGKVPQLRVGGRDLTLNWPEGREDG